MPVQLETPQHFQHLVRSTQRACSGTSSVLEHKQLHIITHVICVYVCNVCKHDATDISKYRVFFLHKLMYKCTNKCTNNIYIYIKHIPDFALATSAVLSMVVPPP